VVTCRNQKIVQAEKYYGVIRDIMKEVKGLEDKGYRFYSGSLHFYIMTDLNKAFKFAEEMLDMEFSPQNNKILRFSIANLHLLKNNYEEATHNYQTVLKLIPDDKLKAYTLNNMAVTGIHQIRKNFNIEMTSEDQQAIIGTFKEAICLLEGLPENKSRKEKQELQGNKPKFSDISISEILDQNTIIPADYSIEKMDNYLGILTNPESTKVITNISEFLLMNEKHNPNNISFWFKLGLDIYDNQGNSLKLLKHV
jgi:tetratricopeptide (TPR) repeat protein